MSLQDKDENYKKLARLRRCMMRKELCINQIQAILDSGFDINFASPTIISTTKGLDVFSGFTALHFAVLSDHADSYLDLLLKRGADVTRKSHKGLTPLFIALGASMKRKDFKYQMVHRLLSHQIKSGNVENPSSDGISHFHLACVAKSFDAVKFFLESGVSVNEPVSINSPFWYGFTPLHLAIGRDNKDVIELLLKHGADFNYLNVEKSSALHFIIAELIESRENNEDQESTLYYEVLLDKILEPYKNDLAEPLDDFGLSYFHVYCLKKNVTSKDLDQFLIKNVNVNARVNPNCQLFGGWTPLQFALCCRNTETAMWLLKQGANLLAKNADGQTPLDYCLSVYNEKPNQIIKILKTQENFKSIRFENGTSLFSVISAFDTRDTLLHFLQSADVNTTIPLDSPLWPGATMLHLSVMLSVMYEVFPSAHVPALMLCLSHGGNMMIQDANGATAFHLLFYSKFLKEFVFKLMDEYMDVSANPIDTNTSLSHFHIACVTKNVELVRMFLSNGVNPNLAIGCQSAIAINCPCDCAFKLKEGSTALHLAVIIKSEELAKLLLEHNADPLVLDAEGFTWMHRAFLSDHFDSFKPLLWLHPDALKSNPTAPGGMSHFHVACRSGNLEAVKALLPFVTDINKPISSELNKYMDGKMRKRDYIGKTPLHWAIETDSEEMVDFLLQNGADIKLGQKDKLSPFYEILLSSMNMSEIIKRVTQEFEKKGMWPDDFGMTKLHVACAIGDLEWLKILLEAGEDVNSRMNHDAPLWPGCTPLDVLVKKFVKSDKNKKQTDAIEFLLNHILEKIESKGLANYEFVAIAEGHLPFHIGCMAGNTEIVEKFLDLGVDVNVSRDCVGYGNAGYFPLHFAVKYGKKSVVELLLKQKINVEAEDLVGNTPLLLAASERPEFIDLFIKSNEFNIESKNLFNETVIDLILNENAVKKIDAVKYIFKLEIDFHTKLYIIMKMIQTYSGDDLKSLVGAISKANEADTDGRNFIHHLVSSRNVQAKEFAHKIEVLVMGGCELDHQDDEGRTPLHRAVLMEDPEMVKTLLLIGADINITDIFGKTPFNLAPLSLTDICKEHVTKLKAAGLYIHPLNENFIQEDRLSALIKYMSLVRGLLPEKIVRKFFRLPLHERLIISDVVETISLREELDVCTPLFKFQQRKIEKRQKLLRSAITSLQSLHNNGIPDHCLESILIHLGNEDWQNLIRATNIDI